jgi:RND superfamily putative drug exporter
MIALAGLLLFPQGFLKSLAYGGLAAVALARALSLTLLPALLAILGPRVDRLPVRLRRRTARPERRRLGPARRRGAAPPVLVAVPAGGRLAACWPRRSVGVRSATPTNAPCPPATPPGRRSRPQGGFPALSTCRRPVVVSRHGGASAGCRRRSVRSAPAVQKVPGVAAVNPGRRGP